MLSVGTVTERLEEETEKLLYQLGEGVSEMDSVAYDTAWVARLTTHYPEYGFEATLPWLRDHQQSDGSWGGGIAHYHDRISSTMAAIIALKEVGNDRQDKKRITKGEAYLWREYGRLAHDANDTGGFPIVIASLLTEALQLGLDVPNDIYHDIGRIKKKLDMMATHPHMWRYTTIALSMEALRTFITNESDIFEKNGSVGVSPAATAASLLTLGQWRDTSLEYLWKTMNAQGDGGVCFANPFDIYEVAWVLDQFRLSEAVSPDHPHVQHLLKFLARQWSPERGVGFSSEFGVADLDDTAVTMGVLDWGGYRVSADVFGAYEQEKHFQCWPGETDISLSVHIRTLAALQTHKDHRQYNSWVRKITALLYQTSKSGTNEYYWFDKWHISPYYLTSATVWLLNGVMDKLVVPRVKWILKTQRPNGGWGYYHRSTSEETAYCLQALLLWDRTVERVPPASIEAAANYLMSHFDDTDHPPLWIGKCIYLPRRIVRAAILSALHSYTRYKDGTQHVAKVAEKLVPFGTIVKIGTIDTIMSLTKYQNGSRNVGETNMDKINVIWDNDEKTVIRYVFAKDYSWNDFHKAIDEAAVLLEQIDHKADVIMDLSSASMLPSGAITQGKWLFANTPHPNIGQTIVVGANSLIQAIVDTSRRLSRQRAENWKLLFAPNVDEARKVLAKNAPKPAEVQKTPTTSEEQKPTATAEVQKNLTAQEEQKPPTTVEVQKTLATPEEQKPPTTAEPTPTTTEEVQKTLTTQEEQKAQNGKETALPPQA